MQQLNNYDDSFNTQIKKGTYQVSINSIDLMKEVAYYLLIKGEIKIIKKRVLQGEDNRLKNLQLKVCVEVAYAQSI